MRIEKMTIVTFFLFLGTLAHAGSIPLAEISGSSTPSWVTASPESMGSNGSNLIQNPNGDDAYDHWDWIDDYGKKGWKNAGGSGTLHGYFDYGFVTGHRDSKKSQTILVSDYPNLQSALSRNQGSLTIRAREYFAKTFCAMRPQKDGSERWDTYYMTLRIKTADGSTLLERSTGNLRVVRPQEASDHCSWTTGKWRHDDDWSVAWLQMEIPSSMKASVHSIEFEHGGSDAENWADHFGAKMRNPAVGWVE